MSTDDLTEHLDLALDSVLALRASLVPLTGPRVPEEALSKALGGHGGFQGAKRAFLAALQAVRQEGLPDQAIFMLESAGHHLAGEAAEVAWVLGTTCRRRV